MNTVKPTIVIRLPSKLAATWLAALLILPWHMGIGAPVSSKAATSAIKGWLRLDPSPLGERLQSQVESVETFRNADKDMVYYVVYLKPSGFVILPGDDLLEPIIAFARQGHFSPSPDNPLGALISKDIPERIRQVRSKRLAAPALEAHSKWQLLQQDSPRPGGPDGGSATPLSLVRVSDVRVAPLLQTAWSQTTAGDGKACYNYYVPPGTNGSPANYPCGCVATAMAQLMYYFQHPSAGVGDQCFAIEVDGWPESACLRGGDGAGGPYAWSNMPWAPTTPTVAQCQAIGALTYDAGIAVDMSYAQDGSGAYGYSIAPALVDIFGYSSAILGQNFGGDFGSGLIGMVNPNLDAHYPVLFSISGDPGGHEIVCDGYGYSISTPYHHLNLGWAGVATAWYALPGIDAGNDVFTSIDNCTYNVYVTGSGEIISGRVLDTAGSPIAGATVTATLTGGGVYQVTTDENGIYALAHLPSDSTYALTAMKKGYSPTNGTYSTGMSLDNDSLSGNVWGADLTLSPTNAIPVITLQPEDRIGILGASVLFAVEATGVNQLKYRWQKNGSPLSDAANIFGSGTRNLTLTNVALTDAGTYSVIVSNSYGSVLSTGAVLRVYALTHPFQITFDDLMLNSTGPVPAGYGGLNWSNFYYLNGPNTGPSGYQAGTVSSSNVAYNASGAAAYISAAMPFSLISAYMTAAWSDDLQVQVEAYTGGVLSYANVYTLSATAPTLINFTYLGVDEVDFVSSGGTLHPGYSHSEPAEQFAVDNMTIATNLVLLDLVAPDLVPLWALPPVTAESGAMVQVACMVTNMGTGSASAPWEDGVYFSTNSALDNAQRLTWMTNTASVARGASYTWTNMVLLPQVASATYYLIVNVDDGNALPETLEMNNVLAVPLMMTNAGLPDLRPMILSAAGPAVAGQQLTVACVVTNQGTGNAYGPWSDALYFSANAALDTNVMKLGYVPEFTNVPAGGSYGWTSTVFLPQVTGGTYYLIVNVNEGGGGESVATNNTLVTSVPLTVPDLRPVSVTAPSSATASGTIQVVAEATNQGTGPAIGPWSDALYLSTNADWSSQAYKIKSYPQSQVVTNGSDYRSTNTVTLPSWAAGTYYLILKLDDTHSVFELVETNNTLATALTMTNAGPADLAPVGLGRVVAVGSQVQISITVTNQGSGAASGSFYDQVYVSSNAVMDSSAVLVSSVTETGLMAGASVTRTNLVTLPGWAAGGGYLIVVADAYGSIYESVKGNNTNAYAFSMNLPDLAPVGLGPVVAAGNQVQISFTVTNRGSGAAIGTYCDWVYVSTKAVMDSSAVVVSSVAETGLVAGASMTRTNLATLPGWAAGGVT